MGWILCEPVQAATERLYEAVPVQAVQHPDPIEKAAEKSQIEIQKLKWLPDSSVNDVARNERRNCSPGRPHWRQLKRFVSTIIRG